MVFSLSFQLNAQNICDDLQKNNFKAIETFLKKRVKTLRKDASFSNNSERLDSLEAEMNRIPCVKKAYWNKNGVFTLNTLQYVHQLGIQFNTTEGVLEKCYLIQTYFSHSRRKGGNNKLTYIRCKDCEGFIRQHLAIDSLNAVSAKKQRQNMKCRIEASILQAPRDRKYPIHIYAHEEGTPIKVKLTIQNFSDSAERFIWPIHQNCGKKIMYFELLNADGSRHLIEDRNVGLPNNELIPYDVLTLKAMEKRTFIHTINGFSQKGQTEIEAHHHLGPIKEGNYKLKVHYDPNPLNEIKTDFWTPIELDSVVFRYSPKLEVIRSRKHRWEQQSFRYQDTVSPLEMSQACFKVRILSGSGDYYYDIGKNSYDGIGIIEEVKKGYQSVGDTIAFSFRYLTKNIAEDVRRDLIKQMFQEGDHQKFWIYATNSFANYCQIVRTEPNRSFLNGKRNYQLINHWQAAQKHLISKSN